MSPDAVGICTVTRFADGLSEIFMVIAFQSFPVHKAAFSVAHTLAVACSQWDRQCSSSVLVGSQGIYRRRIGAIRPVRSARRIPGRHSLQLEQGRLMIEDTRDLDD